MTGILRTSTVLFVDISGSTRLYQELGDAAALRRVRSCLELLRGAVESGSGRVIKHIGDGLMCEFAEADSALRAADAMQVAMAGESSGSRLGIHVGCHHGLIIENAGDLFGDTVNVAARVAGLARIGQIILTQELAERLDVSLQQHVRLLDRVSVKGRRDPLTVFEYLWKRFGDMTIAGVAPARPLGTRLRLACLGRDLWLERSGVTMVSLGRGSVCELVVSNPEASRQHATIEVRGDKFVLVDHSSNGTYVDWEGAPEMCLKREEMILPARGRIALGLSTRAPQATVVEFSLEG
jgi:hypothetical protein